MNAYPRLCFQGQEYILVNSTGNDREGAITTAEWFENGEASYAHLFGDGTIMRFQEVIGTREDIEWLGQVEVEPKAEALFNTLTHPSWEKREKRVP